MRWADNPLPMGKEPRRKTKMPKTTLILDSTQIDAFLTCPQMWKYGHDERLHPIPREGQKDTGEAMAMGTLGHKFLELYYKGKALDMSQQECIKEAEGFDPDMEKCYNCSKPHGEHSKLNAICPIEFTERSNKIINTWNPIKFPLGMPERAAVLQRFREYSYTYTNKDISPAYVEIGFSHLLYEDNDVRFILEGRIDLIGKMGGQTLWADHKFQLRSRDLYKKSIQFRNYGLVMYETMGLNLGLVNYIRLTKGITKDTFKRDIISFSALDHIEWKKRLINIFFIIANRIATDARIKYVEPLEKNWSACSGKFGYPCDFTPLCEEYNQDVIEMKKKTLYQIREEWKPW